MAVSTSPGHCSRIRAVSLRGCDERVVLGKKLLGTDSLPAVCVLTCVIECNPLVRSPAQPCAGWPSSPGPQPCEEPIPGTLVSFLCCCPGSLWL